MHAPLRGVYSELDRLLIRSIIKGTKLIPYVSSDRIAFAQKKKPKSKVEKVLHEFKTGGLHSGSKKGPLVTSRKQAIAIALNQARRGKK